MSERNAHVRCPACGGHIAITPDNTVLPDLGRHTSGCWWRPGMPAHEHTPADTADHFTQWERQMQEPQP